MVSFIGLRKQDAIELADNKDIKINFVLYRSLRGVQDSDSSIVLREKFLEPNLVELVLSEFKTKL